MFVLLINLALLHSTKRLWGLLKNLIWYRSVVCGPDVGIVGLGCFNLFLFKILINV